MLKRIVDFEVAPPPTPGPRGLLALGASAILHAAIILLLIFGIPVSGAASLAQAPLPETSQPIALAPPADKVTPLPKLAQRKPEAPQPPMKEVELGPDSKKPDAPAKEAAKPAEPEPPAEKPREPDPTPDPPKPVETPPVATRRIEVPKPGDFTNPGRISMPTTSPFAPPKLDSAGGAPPPVASARMARSAMDRAGIGATDTRHWERSFDNETSGRCVEIPDLGKNPDGSPVLATVIGRVLDTDGRTPLAGAHLQIVGTQFGTFSDNNGEYRLPFDPHMLEKCRKQYVDVVAPGYRGAQLTLMIGPRVRSDDVVLRKH